MFSDNDLDIPSKLENSRNIQPAEQSEVEFNGINNSATKNYWYTKSLPKKLA